mgnify:CR=1 FL=1
MYLIPKNIKVKKEIFRGIGIVELILLVISVGIGYLCSCFPQDYKIKIFLFFFFPLTSFLLILPLPNGNTVFKILKKYIIYKRSQRKYKIY